MRTVQTFDRASHQFELEALDPLPCGCIAAVFRVDPYDLRVMSLEAKGPYCRTSRHSTGRVVQLDAEQRPYG